MSLDQAGAIWGGQYSFYKITAEAKKYFDIGWQTIFASRLKSVWCTPSVPTRIFRSSKDLLGGEKSVRGYGRRRLGPLSASDDPLGGLSLIEGSLELRRPLWKELNGALFVDFGQVFDAAFRPSGRRSAIFGRLRRELFDARGSLALDIGFPFKPPRGDKPWQIHFSIGAYF